MRKSLSCPRDQIAHRHSNGYYGRQDSPVSRHWYIHFAGILPSLYDLSGKMPHNPGIFLKADAMKGVYFMIGLVVDFPRAREKLVRPHPWGYEQVLWQYFSEWSDSYHSPLFPFSGEKILRDGMSRSRQRESSHQVYEGKYRRASVVSRHRR